MRHKTKTKEVLFETNLYSEIKAERTYKKIKRLLFIVAIK